MTTSPERAAVERGVIVTLLGPGASRARDACLEVFRGVGLLTLVEPGAPGRAAVELAARIRSVILTGAPPAEEDLARIRGHGVRRVSLRVARADGAEAVARRVLALVDHRLEVATRPVFIVGEPRSGTTWTFDLLSSPPDVAGAFETRLFWPGYLGYLGDPDTFKERQTDDDRRYQVGMWQLASREEARIATRVAAANWLARKVLPHHRFLVEKTPRAANSIPVIMEVLPDARIVHVIRDPRDVIASRLYGTGLDGASGLAARRLRLRTIAAFSIEWLTTMHRMDQAESFAPVHEVRYECLHASPLATCSALFAFCKIPCDDTELAAIIDANRFEAHVRRGPGRFRRGGRIGDWRTELTTAEQALIRSIAGREMAARGYVERPGLPYTVRGAAAAAKRDVRKLAYRRLDLRE